VALVVSAILIYQRIKLNKRQLILGSTVLGGIGVTAVSALVIPITSIVATYPLVFEDDANLVNLFIIGFILLGLMILCAIFGFIRFYRRIRRDTTTEYKRLYIEKKFILAESLLGVWIILFFSFYYWDFWSFTPYTNYTNINALFSLHYSSILQGNPMDIFIYSFITVFAISQAFYVAAPPLLSELLHKFEKVEKKTIPLDYDAEDISDVLPFEAYHGERPYLFVSYSHQDKPLVYPIIKRLHKEKVRIWYDEGIPPSGKWIENIASTLKACEMFLIFITPNAVASKHVRNELYFANKNDKKTFPIYLVETDLPDELDIQIGRFQALFKYLMNEKVFWKKLLEQLAKVSD
jgi:hypothetical protein